MNSTVRNYIPLVWGELGFGLYGFMFWKTWINISRKLINEYKTDLNELKINYHDNQFKKTVDMFALFQERKKVELISSDLKLELSFFRKYFWLTLIAFLMFAVLGILTIVMTWK